MSIYNTIILGVITSFVASLIFTYFFAYIKPKLEISTNIAYSNGTYKIKVINKSRFPATNIKAELSYINYFPVPGGQDINAMKIHLVKSEIFALDKYDIEINYAPYTYMFVTRRVENLRYGMTMNNRQYIRLKIKATHSITNIGKVFQQRYTANHIVDGEFVFGNTFEIENA